MYRVRHPNFENQKEQHFILISKLGGRISDFDQYLLKLN